MINMLHLIKAIISGFTTGIAISIPLGPAAIESVNQTISKGFKRGFIVSLGAITADMAYLILINCGLSKLFQHNGTTKSLFWIISGIILVAMQYNDLTKPDDQNQHNVNTLSSFPFWSGFILTFSNPMTPTLWLGLSGTVIRLWRHTGIFYYYSFILSILIGMVTWFGILNILAYKGLNIFKPGHSKKASIIMKWIILLLGIAFIILGLSKLIFSCFK
ncbi:LysE family translocator [Clostridium sp. ZS2-4]|uniref:LysE family translocator n=1 Tax=Clostridium sp. ZS2-4 TaxID=2987703 RepID=UPI00227CC89C|nr:LysE family transporter [Clostridium sp. ZS2-4]MCY6356365.1 LysE family transporter [Clostridium sp. ZS2-4]